MDKLQICKQTRKIAADALAVVLKDVLVSNEQISEVRFRDLWLEELRKNTSIFPDGWYDPPPHGMIVMFATGKDTCRIHYVSSRPPEFWPKDTIYLDKTDGLLFFYCSPVDRNNFIIGDFGLTVYLGKDNKIKNHLKITLDLCEQIFESVTLSKPLSSFAKNASSLMQGVGMYNRAISISAPAGGVNVGHTIPGIDTPWTKEELQKLSKKDWSEVRDAIASKRKMVNEIEQSVVVSNMAFTIEPRPEVKDHPEIPMACFHTICCINHTNQKELLTGFDQIFKIAGMNYMLADS